MFWQKSVNFFKNESQSLRIFLIRGASGTIGFKFANMALTFCVSFMLARLLGSTGYGIYTYVMSWMALMGVVSGLGLGKVVVRSVSSYRAQEDWERLRGLIRFAYSAGILSGLTLMILGIAVVSFMANHLGTASFYSSFVAAFFLLPLQTTTSISSAIQSGMHRILLGQLPESLVRPLVFIALLLFFVLTGNAVSVSTALQLNVLSALLTMCLAFYLLRLTSDKKLKGTELRYESREWLSSALPLILLGGMSTINAQADILMLGALKGPEAAGLYHVATRGANLITFVLLAVNAPLGPVIAQLYAIEKRERLQRIITQSSRVVFLVSLPIAIVFIFAGHWYLHLFGQDFYEARTALVILSTAQLFNIAAGPVQLILIMTGNEGIAAKGMIVSTLINVFLNTLLIPYFGIEGAAVATGTSILIWNVLLIWQIWKRTGVHSTVWGFA